LGSTTFEREVVLWRKEKQNQKKRIRGDELNTGSAKTKGE